MTKVVRDAARLKVWRSPPQVNRPCFRPDWNALILSEGKAKFQIRRRCSRMESATIFLDSMSFLFQGLNNIVDTFYLEFPCLPG